MNNSPALERFEALALACKALAHPARLAILQNLAQRGSCICGEIVDLMPLSQSTVSQHLKVLKEAGLVTGTVEGPKSCYCIDSQALAGLRDDLGGLFGSFENCC